MNKPILLLQWMQNKTPIKIHADAKELRQLLNDTVFDGYKPEDDTVIVTAVQPTAVELSGHNWTESCEHDVIDWDAMLDVKLDDGEDGYLAQAKRFLAATSTILEIKFQYTGVYGSFNDNTVRDVYKFTLRNSKHTYTSGFGNSIANSEYWEIGDFLPGKNDGGPGIRLLNDGWDNEDVDWVIMIRKRMQEVVQKYRKQYPNGLTEQVAKSFKEDAWAQTAYARHRLNRINNQKEKILGYVIRKNERTEPNAYDILACLSPNYCEDFGDFCHEFGYSSSPEGIRHAESVWQAVLAQDNAIKLLWTEDEIEMLNEIQ